MAGRHDDTDPNHDCNIDIDKEIGTLAKPGLRYPRDFLLADERPEDYELNRAALAYDLQPRGALERQQVDLIALADCEGMRHRRFKKNFLPEPSPGNPAATADILRAQRANMAALEFH